LGIILGWFKSSPDEIDRHLDTHRLRPPPRAATAERMSATIPWFDGAFLRQEPTRSVRPSVEMSLWNACGVSRRRVILCLCAIEDNELIDARFALAEKDLGQWPSWPPNCRLRGTKNLFRKVVSSRSRYAHQRLLETRRSSSTALRLWQYVIMVGLMERLYGWKARRVSDRRYRWVSGAPEMCQQPD